MTGGLKKFLTLDFEKAFLGSFLKLLFFWNPLWILMVILFWERNLGSFFFDWSRKFFVATLAVLFGMAVVKGYLLVERALAARRSSLPTRHSIGWYLLLLAFGMAPGFYLGSRLMVAALNWIFNVGSPIPVDFPWPYYRKEIFAGWTFLLVCFLFISWQDLRDEARLAQLRAEELEKERLQALLTKLKDQMNPHFLFNTLNTVASLIPADPAKAEQVVVKLSTIYQGILAATRKTTHPLAQELSFCRDYLDIEKIRFGERLKTRISVAKGLDSSKVLVPVLLLQPLVENAVKHGLSARASGGSLWILVSQKNGLLEIAVEDNGVGFGNSPYSGSGTALENCRKRLELSYGKDGRLEISPRKGGGTRITMSLPRMTYDPGERGEK